MTGFVSSDPLDNLTNLYNRPITISNTGRAPTITDLQPAGTLWQTGQGSSGIMYISQAEGIWAQIASGSSGGGIMSLTPDSGGPVTPLAGTVVLSGITGLSTEKADTNTIQVSASASFLQTVSITLTSSQVKNLLTVPIQILPAPGAGKVILPMFITLNLNYGGTNAFTSGGNINLSFYNGTTAYQILSSIVTDMFITSTSSQYLLGSGAAPGTVYPSSEVENFQVVLENLGGGGNYGGNAANNNTLIVSMQYGIL